MPSILLAVVLAFILGYSLTLRPLLASGMAVASALRLAFAADTLFALAAAGVAAYPVNRWLIQRGRGHAVLHGHHH